MERHRTRFESQLVGWGGGSTKRKEGPWLGKGEENELEPKNGSAVGLLYSGDSI